MWLALLVWAEAFASPTALDPNADHLYYADLLNATAKFDQIIVSEGLPREYVGATLAQTLAAKGFRIGDQGFYGEPLPLKDDEKAAVSDAVLKHIENFRVWSGVKFCGGFHADFAIEWRLNGVILANALFCFGCHEARFYVGDRVELVDQSDEGFNNFRALLLPHRQHSTRAQSVGARATPTPPAEKMVIPEVEIIAPPSLPAEPPPKIEVVAPTRPEPRS